MATTTEHPKPVDELSLGRIRATIWRNDGRDGRAFYNVRISRLYRDGDEWKQTASFGRNDLLVVAKLADLAHTRVHELLAADRAGDPDPGDGE